MHITQFAHMNGTPINFKPGDPIIGNCAHLEQVLYLVVASGSLEGQFQQMLVKNASGQMEPLSAEIQMADTGNIEMVFPSNKETQIFQRGSLIEVRPGCAYALKAQSEGLLIEYVLPISFSSPLLGQHIGLMADEPFKDLVTFELLKPSIPTSSATTSPTSVTSSSSVTSPSPVASPCSMPSSEPLTQRYFYKEEGAGVLKISLYAFGLLICFSMLLSSSNPLFFILFLCLTLFGGYWTTLECLQLYRKAFTLGIEKDGIIINNVIYSGLFIRWDEIDRFQMSALSHGRYNIEGELVIEVIPKIPINFIKWLNPLSREWFKFISRNGSDVLQPTIVIKQSGVTIDLNQLLPQLIAEKWAFDNTEKAPQVNS